MALVKFTNDIYPYCTGDVVKIEGAEKERVDKTIADRGVDGYKVVKAESKVDEADTVKTETKAESKK